MIPARNYLFSVKTQILQASLRSYSAAYQPLFTAAPGQFQGKCAETMRLEAKHDECELFQTASPSVRNLIMRYSLSLMDIKGTGKDGRIVKEDVMAYLKSHQSQQAAHSAI